MSHLPEFGEPDDDEPEIDSNWVGVFKPKSVQRVMMTIEPIDSPGEPEFVGVAVTGCAAEPGDPRPYIRHHPTITLRDDTTPRDAADYIRDLYPEEWIADLLVALLDRTAFTETP